MSRIPLADAIPNRTSHQHDRRLWRSAHPVEKLPQFGIPGGRNDLRRNLELAFENDHSGFPGPTRFKNGEFRIKHHGRRKLINVKFRGKRDAYRFRE